MHIRERERERGREEREVRSKTETATGNLFSSKRDGETGHRGVCCNPCNWDGRNWMPTVVGDP